MNILAGLEDTNNLFTCRCCSRHDCNRCSTFLISADIVRIVLSRDFMFKMKACLNKISLFTFDIFFIQTQWHITAFLDVTTRDAKPPPAASTMPIRTFFASVAFSTLIFSTVKLHWYASA